MPIVRSFAAGLEPAVFSIFITLPLIGLNILGVGSAAAVLIDATVPGVCDHPGRSITSGERGCRPSA